VGDEIIVTNFRETLVYQVIYYKIIQPDETGEILIQPGRELLSLFSCHPLGDNTPRNQRYLVVCERVG